MYSIDLEPITIDDFKCLMEQYVGNRISTNSLFVYESFEEKKLNEEWSDDIDFNFSHKQLKACQDIFKKGE